MSDTRPTPNERKALAVAYGYLKRVRAEVRAHQHLHEGLFVLGKDTDKAMKVISRYYRMADSPIFVDGKINDEETP